MDLENDLLIDDETGPARPNVRRRFQPKAKPRPKKETTESFSTSFPSNVCGEAILESLPDLATSQFVRPPDVGDDLLTNPVGSTVVATSEIKESFTNNVVTRGAIVDANEESQLVKSLLQDVVTRDDLSSINVPSKEATISESKYDSYSGSETFAKEAVSTEFDFDLFADTNPKAAAESGGRYQPNYKHRPKVETGASDVKQEDNTHISFGSDVEQLDQPIVTSNEDIRLTNPVGLPLSTSEIVGTEEQMKVSEDPVHLSDGCGDSHSSFEKAAVQNADLFCGLEFLNNFPSQLTHETGINDTQAQCSLNSSTPRVGAAPQVHPSDLFMTQGPVNCLESAICNDGRAIPVGDKRLETQVQQAEAFSDLDTLGFTSEEIMTSGGRAGKYKPKPKGRIEKEKPNTSTPQRDAVESVTHQQHAHFVSSEIGCMYEDSVPAYEEFDYLSVAFDDVIPPDHNNSGDPINEELGNLVDCCEDTGLGDVPEMAENLKSMGRKGDVANDSTVAHGDTKAAKLSRQQRKRVTFPELDEPDDDNFDAEPPSCSVDGEDVNARGEADTSQQMKSAPGKTRKLGHEKDKPVQKRRKHSEASEQSTKEPPKKFSHSTRRKRRRVSKELLETPEDEIDPRKVPIKDLILLAEYRERLASKEAKTSTIPLKNQSAEKSFHEDEYHDEEDTFASEQGSGSFDNQEPRRVQSSSIIYNYQSFMKKTPKVRWSKQDTELFYQAIRQFGTDLSMIQQLFPGRSRQQIKLKYKKEERQHPLRLSEAMTSRATDHSHFEKVIEQLQRVAAQSGRSKKDDPADLLAEEDVGAEKVKDDEGADKVEEDEGAEKDGKDEDAAVEDREANVDRGSSPPKADESDNDFDFGDYNF